MTELRLRLVLKSADLISGRLGGFPQGVIVLKTAVRLCAVLPCRLARAD